MLAERVSFNDLNLERPAGAHTLLQRIHSAAQRVCGPDEGLHSDGAYGVCMREAVNRAVRELDIPW